MNENNHDLRKGYLKKERLFVKHHEAIEAVEEQGHWETVREYSNGGKEVKWIVDVEAVEGKEAWDEYEEIETYVRYTREELVGLAKTPLTSYEKLQLLAESIEEEPYPNLPPTPGYSYQRVYSRSTGKIVWTLAMDPDNPVEFTRRMSVTKDLYYTDGIDTYLCIQNGKTDALENTEYFKKCN